MQEANLAYHYPIIYWNTANLISDSGGEDGNVTYGKIALAIGTMQKAGIKIALPSVNESRFDFRPDVKNNQIIYGLKPIRGIGTKTAKAIIANQPYISANNFYQKMQVFKEEDKENKFGDQAMISLIKAGCFDKLENKSRLEIMESFIRQLSSPLTSLKITNIEDLNSMNLLTEHQKKFELRLVRFRKYLYQKKFFVKQTGKSPTTAYYKLDRKFAEPFFLENFESDMVENKDYEYDENGFIIVKKGSLDRVFKKLIADFEQTVLKDLKNIEAVNEARFKSIWNEKVSGTISKWEMDSLCFYYSGHELENVNKENYNISNFYDINPQPEMVDVYYYKGQEKPRFKLYRIAGTVLDRDKNKHLVTLLTTDGVVSVKFYKGQFGFYDKQIVQINSDGSKTVLEKSWFSRGTKLLITGFRREEQFVPRVYKDSIYRHSVQLIKEVKKDNSLVLISDRIEVNN